MTTVKRLKPNTIGNTEECSTANLSVDVFTSISEQLLDIEKRLCHVLQQMDYGEQVAYTYSPINYAWNLHKCFVHRFCQSQKDVLIIGMNPGPWGMGQTGVPFGHVGYVKGWLGIDGTVTKPINEHPLRPVLGLDCKRNEVSGERFWSLFKELSGSPETFFDHFFIINYCPLFYLKTSGKNVTPADLKVAVRRPLEDACDKALLEVINLLRVKKIICVGKYVTERIRAILVKTEMLYISVDTLMHPSPVNPAANKGWHDIAIKQLGDADVLHYFKN